VQAGAIAEHAHGLATLGIIYAQRGALEAGLAALRTSFDLARKAGSVEDVVRAAANHMYLLCTAGRFPEALAVGREGRRAATALDTPTALTSVLDNNIAAVLVTIGQWQEADRLLTELADQSSDSALMSVRLVRSDKYVDPRTHDQLAAAVATTAD
jgi:hypothetical protein